MLLVTRKSSSGWMVPGGGVELDEEVEHAAIRELQEEVCDCLCSVNFAYDKNMQTIGDLQT